MVFVEIKGDNYESNGTWLYLLLIVDVIDLIVLSYSVISKVMDEL